MRAVNPCLAWANRYLDYTFGDDFWDLPAEVRGRFLFRFAGASWDAVSHARNLSDDRLAVLESQVREHIVMSKRGRGAQQDDAHLTEK